MSLEDFRGHKVARICEDIDVMECEDCGSYDRFSLAQDYTIWCSVCREPMADIAYVNIPTEEDGDV